MQIVRWGKEAVQCVAVNIKDELSSRLATWFALMVIEHCILVNTSWKWFIKCIKEKILTWIESRAYVYIKIDRYCIKLNSLYKPIIHHNIYISSNEQRRIQNYKIATVPPSEQQLWWSGIRGFYCWFTKSAWLRIIRKGQESQAYRRLSARMQQS